MNRFENVKSGSRWSQTLSSVRYFEFVALIDGYRIKIVLKQVNEGPIFFLSVIPAWRKNLDSDEEPLILT